MLLAFVTCSSLNDAKQVMAQSLGVDELENFIARGDINSTLYTISGNWVSQGKWVLTVSDGKVASLIQKCFGIMVLQAIPMNLEILKWKMRTWRPGTDGTVSIGGEMDVGTNKALSWPSVPAEISIEKGKFITISVDDDETNNHFGDQSVYGKVSSIQPCNLIPGPDMEVPVSC